MYTKIKTCLLLVMMFSLVLPVLAVWPGNCLNFEAGDYVDGGDYGTTLTSVTMEAWVKHNTLGSGIQRYLTLSNELAVIRYSGTTDVNGFGQIHFYIKNTAGTLKHCYAYGLVVGEWQHVAGTYDGTTMKIYLNGELVGSSVASPGGLFSVSAYSGTIQISRSDESMLGQIDEVRLASSALDQSYIRGDRFGYVSTSEVLCDWRFDETSGTTAYDSQIWSSNHGTLHNMTNANWVASTVPSITRTAGNALSFNGTNQYVKLNQRSGLPIYNNGTSNAYSIGMWVKGSAPATSSVFYSEGSTTNASTYFSFNALSTGKTSVYIVNNGSVVLNNVSTLTTIWDNAWHYITWTDNNGTAKMYVDGLLDGASFNYTRQAMILNTTGLGCLLRSGPNGFFSGQIDEVYFWTTALTLAQVRQKMNGITVGQDSGQTAYWQFNETSGSTVYDVIKGNNGTMYNMTDANRVASGAPIGASIGGAIAANTVITDNPTYIYDDLTINNGVTLTVNPGVTVKFMNSYKLNVQGRLLAVGTALNNITFTAYSTSGWKGIRLDNTPATNDSTKIVYCRLENGIATGTNWDNAGGAIYANIFSKILISNSVFNNNRTSAGWDGGAIYLRAAYAKIENCTFTNNYANGNGGALAIGGGYASVYSSVFRNNSCATRGGAVLVASPGGQTYFYNSVFYSNASNNTGGAIGMTDIAAAGVRFYNCTIWNNSAVTGGGVELTSGLQQTRFANSIIWGNTASSNGSQIAITGGVEVALNLDYDDIQNGTAGIYYSAGSSNGASPTNCFALDPGMSYFDTNPGSGFMLSSSSPCKNMGYAFTGHPTRDVNGNLRNFDNTMATGNLNTALDRIDIGAIEETSNNAILPDGVTINANANVTSDLYLHAGRSLIINAGITLSFAAAAHAYIYGNLTANGTVSNRITFTEQVAGSGWQGLHFLKTTGFTPSSTLGYCIVEKGNMTSGDVIGGNIYINQHTTISINNCIIRNGLAEIGGGIYTTNSTTTLINTIICDNVATVRGPGFYSNTATVKLTNCTLAGNTKSGSQTTVQYLAPVYMVNVTAMAYITNCLIYGNSTTSPVYTENSSLTTVTYSDVEGGYAGTGNINVNPAFTGEAGHPYNLNIWSYCINAGRADTTGLSLPAVDLKNTARIYAHPNTSYNRVDMGAYEVQSYLAPTNFVASDGSSAYPGYVYITWSFNPAYNIQPSGFRIYRNGTQYAVVDGQTLSYSDNEPVAGTIYTYKVQAYTTTESTFSTEDQGYIKPNGIISGKVETTNGNPVVAVKVTITPSTGYCLQLNSANASAISFTNPQANLNQNFTVEMWVKTLNSNVELLHTGTHILSINASGLVQYTDGTNTLIQQNTAVDINNDSWHHIAIVSNYTDNRVEMYLDDTKAASATGYRFMNYVQSDVYVPAGLTGRVDDIRIWTAARDSSAVVDAMSIVVPYDSPGLRAYWALNEGIGSNAFDGTDYSHNGALANCTWSNAGPEMQMGALTNEWGEYIISQIAYGTATNFSVHPAKTGHMFQPEQRVVTLSASNIAANNVDFTDNSMIPITGYAKFQGTICPVVGAVIYLNGEAAMPRITTDEDGYYTLEVEHGTECIVSIDYNGHEFNRIWNLGAVTYPRNNINFEDVFRTEYKLEVVGGHDSYPIGDFNVTMASVDGLYTREITSQNWDSGFINVSSVVPLEYNVTVTPGSNDPFALLIDEQFQSMKTKYFDLRNPDAILDTLRYEWRAPLEVQVAWPDTMQLKAFPEYPSSEFYVVNQNDWVEITISSFEDYNYGAFTNRKSYLTDCDITIVDEVGPENTTENNFDGETEYVYKFAPYLPNINGGYARQYQNKLEVTVRDNALNRFATQTDWCLTQGAKPMESTYATTSPEIPFLVLHDPPGDGSFASFNQSNSHSFAMSTKVCTDREQNAYGTLHLGHNFNTEAGGLFFSVGTELSIIADLSYGLTMNTTQENSTEQTLTLTTSQEYRTSEGDIIGDGADLFVGGALNLVWGLTKELSWDDLNQAAVLESNVMVTPNGFQTIYLYTDLQIRNTIIPNCLAIGDTTSANLWQSYLDKNEYNKEHAVANSNHPGNISFNAGAGYTYEEENSTESSNTIEFETTVSTEFGAEIGLIVDGTGAEGGYKFKTQITTGRSSTTTDTNTTSTSFTLADDDESSDLTNLADYFTVDIKKDPVYGTPVFDLVSGASSNHWEPNTQPRDGVMMTANTYTASNVPQDQPALFVLYLNNTSQTNEPRRYYLEVMHGTNPIGATVKINGVVLEGRMAFDIDSGAAVQAVMTVESGPLGYELEGLTLEFYADGDRGNPGPDNHYFDVFKTFDIFWEAPYSRVAINYPQDGWLINQALNNNLNVVFQDYDLTKPDFKSIKLQYKHPSDLNWLPAFEVFRAELADHPAYISVPWDVSSLADGVYEIRAATTDSIQADWYTPSLLGTIDRSSPEIWGVPQPADGILQLGDVISLTFDENINPLSIVPGRVAIRVVRTDISVDATVQCYDNTISIVPNIANYWLENETVEVQVTGLTDLYGNQMEGTTTWEFFVNSNPVNWQTTKMEVIKPLGQAMTLSTQLINTGGQSSSFSLVGLPVWLTANPMSGSLLPLDSETISFTISPQLGFGTFCDTLYADIPGLGREPLIISVSVLANPPAWTSTVNYNYDYTMTITGQLVIDNASSEDTNDIIGAFIQNESGDYECRGVARTAYVNYLGGSYQFFLTMYSDMEYGQPIQFRVWDDSQAKEHYGIVEEYTFESAAVYGTPVTPVAIHASQTLVQEINCGRGWTWISTSLLNSQSMQVNSVLAGLSPAANDVIKSQTQFAQYTTGSGWLGSLSTIANTKMYKIKLASADKLVLTGIQQNPLTTSITYGSGWNWISYIPHVSISVNEALAGISNLATGDMVKSQRAYAQYISGYGWVGSLSFMNPGEGFLLKTANTGSFHYPDYQIPRDGQRLRDPDTLPSVPGWTLNPLDYEYSANITGLLQFNGIAVMDDAIIGAFVGNQCRGIAGAIDVMGSRMYFLTQYSNSYNETLHFKVYYPATQTYVDLPNTLPFVNNQILGNPHNPYGFILPYLQLYSPANVRIMIEGGFPTIKWDAVSGANSYNVYSSSNPSVPFETWVLEASSVVTPQWTDRIVNGQKFYRITAIKNSRDSSNGTTERKPEDIDIVNPLRRYDSETTKSSSFQKQVRKP